MVTGNLSRSLVYGSRGIVCSNSPLAASTGIQVMREGGNAFDAALAVAAVETVTLVPLCSMGGDSFILAHEAATDQITGINSSGAAATGATAEYYRSRGYETMPIDGPHSITVPGEIAAWEELHRRFCTMPFATLLEPAVGYADEGFPVSPGIGRNFAHAVDKLAQFPASAAIYASNGGMKAEGEMLVNRDLARSLQQVARGGADEFYRGDLARRMVAGLRKAGALFTESDFAEHRHDVYDPIATTYRDYTVYQTRPPTQGFLLLEMLNLVEDFDLGSMGQNSSQAIHLMTEAKKIAYGDRNRLAGDPRYVEWPLEELISKPYAARRRGEIDPSRANNAQPAFGEGGDGNTTYFCVADGAGNCVSWIHSLSNSFGSGFVAEGTGILFNNRGGRGFSLEPGHPNVIEPGKRTMHTLNCYMAYRDGQPAIVGGTPGGDYQPQCGLQVLSNLIDHGMDPQDAVEAPRWWSFPGTDPASLKTPLELRLEAGMPEDIGKELEGLGHRVVRRRPGINDGKVQLIVRDLETGILKGASDPRGDGHAAAW
ncbi:MAG: gamma-glutamyltransferase [Chloroflexota bacterium]|nr:gamma-glutamyltransferase [Chloroflexota bacterium]